MTLDNFEHPPPIPFLNSTYLSNAELEEKRQDKNLITKNKSDWTVVIYYSVLVNHLGQNVLNWCCIHYRAVAPFAHWVLRLSNLVKQGKGGSRLPLLKEFQLVGSRKKAFSAVASALWNCPRGEAGPPIAKLPEEHQDILPTGMGEGSECGMQPHLASGHSLCF